MGIMLIKGVIIMRKNLISILCLLCFAGCAYAEVYQVPGSLVETTTQVTTDNTQQVNSKTKVKRKKIRRIKDTNPTNTYWNFGRPPFWTGTI